MTPQACASDSRWEAKMPGPCAYDSGDEIEPAATAITTAPLSRMRWGRAIPMPGTRIHGGSVHSLDLIAGWIPVGGTLDVPSPTSDVIGTQYSW